MRPSRFILCVAAVAVLFALMAHSCKLQAQQYQFSQGTYLTMTTNSSAPLANTVFGVTLPPLALTITCTNANTVITNTIFNVITYTNSFTFVYSAATMGTNFSTNFNNGNPISFSVTNLTYGQAAPQSGGTNTATVK